MEPETRQRGIFAAVVYRARVELTGILAVPADIPAGEHDWREAAIVLGATDLRATAAEPVLESGDARIAAAGASGWEACRGMETLRWPLRLGAPPVPGTTIPFSVAIDLRGTSSFRLLAAARRTAFEASAPWTTPSFAGTDLPARSEITGDAFRAEWLAGNRQAGARISTDWCEAVARTAGVQEINLLEAVPTYRMVNRAAKYAVLIVALALLTYTLLELLARVAIHPVQYALVGLSVVLFPLLLLALGEPLGFSMAFAIAAAMVTAQSGAYTLMTTRRPGLALLFVGLLAGMFAFVHTVLRLESYSLLAGAVALFAGLSVLMAVTRHVRWGG
jgi:inner membrane protein